MSKEPVTKEDLRDLKKEIVNDISGVITDAMTNIATNFEELKTEVGELKTEVKDIKITVNRMEQKLDPTIERVDKLSLEVRHLKQKTA